MIYGQFNNVESDFEMQNMDSIFTLGAVNSLYLPRIDQALALIFEQIRQMNKIDKCKIDVNFFCEILHHLKLLEDLPGQLEMQTNPAENASFTNLKYLSKNINTRKSLKKSVYC